MEEWFPLNESSRNYSVRIEKSEEPIASFTSGGYEKGPLKAADSGRVDSFDESKIHYNKYTFVVET